MSKPFPIYIAITGFCFVVVGIMCAWYAFPIIEKVMIKKNTRLLPENEVFDNWKNLPFPLRFSIYLFNVTNPEEVHNGGLPILREVGPYVYDEYRSKNIIKMKEENDSVEYFSKRTFYFNKDKSMCYSDEDVVTIINAGLMTTAVMVEAMAPMALTIINDAIPYLFPTQKTIFMTGKVKDILFDGMKMDCQSEEVEMVCGAVRSKMPPTLRVAENNQDYLAAMFYHINGTWEGPWEVTRGGHNTERGQILSYKNQSSATKWGNTFCDMLNGTDLTVLPSLNEKPEELYFFVQDFCRSFHSSFDSEILYHDILSYKYISKTTFQQGDIESCFCVKDRAQNPELAVCTPSGTLNIAPCVQAPIVISYPHFYLADPKLLKSVKGLEPKKEKHMTFVIAEAKTSTPVSIRFRLQMNIYLRKVDGIDLLQNVSETLFPIAWIEEALDMPPEYISKLKYRLGKLKIFTVIQWLFIITGLILLCVSFVLNMYREKIACFSRKKSSKIQDIRTVDPIKDKSGEDPKPNVYPYLYPQLMDKDVNVSFRRGQHNFNK